MWLSYERTINEVNELAETRFNGKVRILEIGAFAGVVATALKIINADFEVTAWDLPMFMKDNGLIEHYKKMGIHQASGNLAHLPLGFSSEAFDIIICCEVIEHLNFNPLPVFCEFNRLLKSGGILYIGTPNHANIVKRLLLARGKSIHNPVQHLVWQLNPEATFSIGLHWREYTAAELKEILQLAGYEVLHSYFVHMQKCNNPNVLRWLLVRGMYACFPAFLPFQVAIGVKRATCDVSSIRI